jgi:adenylylsulfate kinase
MSKEKKTICVDFDGVIAQYGGFEGQDKFGEPVDGVQNALKVLKEHGYTIIVFTTRKNRAALRKYLKDNDITYDAINQNPDQPEGTNEGKPIADVYLDDRAVTFRGNWKRALEDIAMFKPYNTEKKDEKKEMNDAFDEYRKFAQNNKGIICG